MNITERANAQMDMTVKWRQDIWKDHQVRDAPPMIGWLTEGNESYDHAPTDVVMDLYRQAGDEDTPSVIYSVLTHAAKRPGFTKFREIVFITESYGWLDTEPPPLNLEEDYQTNPNSKVREQMTLVIVADDLVGGAESTIVFQPYAISDGGELTFGDRIVHGPDDKGPIQSAIVDVMKWGIEHAHEG